MDAPQLAECLPSVHEALGSVLSTAQWREPITSPLEAEGSEIQGHLDHGLQGQPVSHGVHGTVFKK